MAGWNPDEWRWDAEPSSPRRWDPQRWDEEPWTVDGRLTRDWAAAHAPTSDRQADYPAGPGPVLLAAAGGVVVATGLGLLVLLLGGLVLLGGGALVAAWARGAR